MGDLDNDMDELFRKAANHYPLKTDGADWEKLMGKLPEDAVGTPLPSTQQKSTKTNRKLLWLVLLFPLGWLCNSYYDKIESDKKILSTIEINSSKTVNDIIQLTDNKQITTNKNTNQNSLQLEKNNSNKPKSPVLANTYYTPNKKENVGNLQNDLYSGRTFSTANGNKSDELKNASKKEIIQQISGDDLPFNLNSTKNVLDNTTSTINNVKPTVDSTTLAINKKDSLPLKNIDTTKNTVKKTTPKSIGKTKGFYISAIGGFDASSVKSQGVKKVGYGFGLLVGYQLNKHIAFETGLLWDKKKYYTDGEYFSKTRTDIPSNYYISDINGDCNMFEVPIDFRYNFAQSKKGLFFATAGLSSYFMKKEAYNYEATAWGATWPAMKTYNNSGNNLFSVINLSAGLEHKITKSISVRINPYLKIPLKGLGIGSIPITSSGINIGLTVPLHK